MKGDLRCIILLLICIIFSTKIQAQIFNDYYAKNYSDDYYLENNETLKLDENQEEAIKELDKIYDKIFNIIENDYSLSSSERNQRKEDLAKERKTDIYSLLSSEQQSIWKSIGNSDDSFNNKYRKNSNTLFINDYLREIDKKYVKIFKEIERDKTISEYERVQRKKILVVEKQQEIDEAVLFYKYSNKEVFESNR